MSGPIIGRRLSRRQNNSEIGSLETLHDAGPSGSSPSNRANTYEDSRASNYGIRTMDQVMRGVFNSTYRDLASGGGSGTTNHPVFGSNTANPNAETFGGGAVGEDIGVTRGANALRIYGDNRFKQSKYPYYTPFFSGNEISTQMQAGNVNTDGYGGPNAQGYRDSTSRARAGARLQQAVLHL